MGEFVLEQNGTDIIISVGSEVVTTLMNRTIESTVIWFNNTFKNARYRIA